ncbi:hypothetical protein BpHYR1_001075 [Brachionus plicatilis]|uniref:Uncharacterized protein n=1 Tax=Brachionus plicatilis TaxID=10195 RepID=A0A3M7S6C6_BRAPC|nr:hypothetical protein BpHYR1_001075 [Brachionus plicatilis]
MQLVAFRILCLLQIFKTNGGHIFENKKLEQNKLYLLLPNKCSITRLINYWPIENGNTNDLIDSKNMHSPSNAEFTEDRFGNPNSSIILNHGYMIIPSGNYFGNTNNKLFFKIFGEENIQKSVTSNMVVQLNRWYHLAFIQINGKMSIHVDGNQEAYLDTGVSNIFVIKERTNCYFGKSNWNNNPTGNFVYDEIKFFDKELIDEEIKSEFNFGYH